jgi:hypothetical protein
MPGNLHVVGLKGLQRDLRAIDAELPRELRKINAEAAKKAQEESQTEASGMGGVQAKAAAGLKASGTQTAAALVIDARQLPYTLGAFLGAKKYPQFPEWVGNDWEPGGPGGPYAVGDALRKVAPKLIDEYDLAVDRLLRTESSVFGAGVQGDVTEF